MTWHDWAHRHPLAAAELTALLAPDPPAAAGAIGSEARIQSEIRLEAARLGVRLYRNNSGALMDDGGRLVRFGLGHESAQLNERLKSSDLIGWRRVTITADMVGRDIAQIVCREVKAPGWRLLPGDKRGQAQAAWLAMCASDGGDACFATSVGTLTAPSV